VVQITTTTLGPRQFLKYRLGELSGEGKLSGEGECSMKMLVGMSGKNFQGGNVWGFAGEFSGEIMSGGKKCPV